MEISYLPGIRFHRFQSIHHPEEMLTVTRLLH